MLYTMYKVPITIWKYTHTFWYTFHFLTIRSNVKFVCVLVLHAYIYVFFFVEKSLWKLPLKGKVCILICICWQREKGDEDNFNFLILFECKVEVEKALLIIFDNTLKNSQKFQITINIQLLTWPLLPVVRSVAIWLLWRVC